MTFSLSLVGHIVDDATSVIASIDPALAPEEQALKIGEQVLEQHKAAEEAVLRDFKHLVAKHAGVLQSASGFGRDLFDEVRNELLALAGKVDPVVKEVEHVESEVKAVTDPTGAAAAPPSPTEVTAPAASPTAPPSTETVAVHPAAAAEAEAETPTSVGVHPAGVQIGEVAPPPAAATNASDGSAPGSVVDNAAATDAGSTVRNP